MFLGGVLALCQGGAYYDGCMDKLWHSGYISGLCKGVKYAGVYSGQVRRMA